jgi:ribonuclease HII
MLAKCIKDEEIGIDEAGRGPLFGRVYASAVIWGNQTQVNNLITDSKKLSAKKRAEALKWIKTNVRAWGVGWADASEIDTINILEATKLAMDRAVQNLFTTFNIQPNAIDTLIIDGTGWEKKFPNYTVISVIKGDATYLSIAAASIIAKEYHDEYINQLCDAYPDLDAKYALKSNMGYGTKKHLDGLAIHGSSQFHRKTFKPLKIYSAL